MKGHRRRRGIHQEETFGYSKKRTIQKKAMCKENIQIKRRLYGEMKRNTNLKGIYTEK